MKPTKVTIRYNAAVKAALPDNKFENATVSYGVEEEYDTEGMTDVNTFRESRTAELMDIVGDIVVEKYNKIKEGEL